ncbi:MAG TPA: hypothetical protein VKM72_29020 [Thermoanaerobaculia bacterium]|nr:hypothetical protein [Thermoanaerobaculia bacterium]
MRHFPESILPLSLLALLLGGCSLSSPQDTVLDCTALFPELTEAAARPGSGPAKTGGEPVGVPLAGILAAELSGDGWSLFADDTVTVLTHTTEAGNLDALVYAEAFSGWEKNRPSEEARRFLLTVDPALLRKDWSWGSPPATVAAGLETPPAVSPPPLRAVTGMAMTRTGGRGLGYTSEPGSFSGWKWIGANPRGVFLRLARSQGRWGEQEPLGPALRPSLDRLAQKFPQTGWMTSGLTEGEASDAQKSLAAPAALVLGSASTPDGEVHLALLCTRAPACGVAPALAGLLASLHPISSREIEMEGAARPLEELLYAEPEIRIASQTEVLPLPPL